jgi:hypothetical protein
MKWIGYLVVAALFLYIVFVINLRRETNGITTMPSAEEVQATATLALELDTKAAVMSISQEAPIPTYTPLPDYMGQVAELERQRAALEIEKQALIELGNQQLRDVQNQQRDEIHIKEIESLQAGIDKTLAETKSITEQAQREQVEFAALLDQELKTIEMQRAQEQNKLTAIRTIDSIGRGALWAGGILALAFFIGFAIYKVIDRYAIDKQASIDEQREILKAQLEALNLQERTTLENNRQAEMIYFLDKCLDIYDGGSTKLPTADELKIGVPRWTKFIDLFRDDGWIQTVQGGVPDQQGTFMNGRVSIEMMLDLLREGKYRKYSPSPTSGSYTPSGNGQSRIRDRQTTRTYA